MRVLCPHCQKSLRLDENFKGNRARCPACGGVLSLGLHKDASNAHDVNSRHDSAPKGESATGTNSFGVVVSICGMICIVAIGLLIWFIAVRDTWEIENSGRIARTLEEAYELREPEPFEAYKKIDAVLQETHGRKFEDAAFASKLEEAARIRDELYPKVQAQIQAAEREQQRKITAEAERIRREQEAAAQEVERQRAADEARKLEEAIRLAKDDRRREAGRAYRNAPHSARVALNALKKVEARTEVGVIYADYSKVVGEMWGDVKIFIESPDGKKLPEFNIILAKAAADYKLALDIWSARIQTTNPYFKFYRPEVEALQQRCWLRASIRIRLGQSLLDNEDIEGTLRAIEGIAERDDDLNEEWKKLEKRINEK